MVKSTYIHIPFCHKICHYCDFIKHLYDEQLVDRYLMALENEIQTTFVHEKKQMRTIFIGGGTPTALTLEQLEVLLRIIDTYFDLDACEEFTIEANPEKLSYDKMLLLKAYGVNRISLGVQAFDDAQLEALGRYHRVKDVYEAIDNLRRADFTNVSLDLIYGLPNQTVDSFAYSLETALNFELQHYSTYSLQVEPQTIFYSMQELGTLHRPTHDEEADMFEILQAEMKKHRYNQYEISNFSKEGYEGKHNLTYWNNDYYYGFGAGSHGYIDSRRTINIRPIPAYIKACETDGNPLLKVETLTLENRIEEEFFLGLQKTAGVEKEKFFKKFGISCNAIYKKQIKSLIEKGWLKESDDRIYLTETGIMFGDDVFGEFLLEPGQI